MSQNLNKNEALVEASDATLGRLYIAVCSDNENISVGLQSAQAVHAGFSFATKHPEITNDWLTDSQYLVIVSVPTSFHILELANKAEKLGIDHVVWREPDLGNQPTAIALAPVDASRILCANLPLAGKPRNPVERSTIIMSRSADGNGAIAYSDENFLHTVKKETKTITFGATKNIYYEEEDEDYSKFDRL